MVTNFYRDLEKAKKAEALVKDVLSSLTSNYNFIDVSNIPAYYHKGDIVAVDKESGKQIFIEVKDDSRIADTQNILCEDSVYYYETGEEVKGNFHSDYEVYCIVSQPERKIYFYDFGKLKEVYKSWGEFKVIRHQQQESYVYLLSTGSVKRALLNVVEY